MTSWVRGRGGPQAWTRRPLRRPASPGERWLSACAMIDAPLRRSSIVSKGYDVHAQRRARPGQRPLSLVASGGAHSEQACLLEQHRDLEQVWGGAAVGDDVVGTAAGPWRLCASRAALSTDSSEAVRPSTSRAPMRGAARCSARGRGAPRGRPRRATPARSQRGGAAASPAPAPPPPPPSPSFTWFGTTPATARSSATTASCTRAVLPQVDHGEVEAEGLSQQWKQGWGAELLMKEWNTSDALPPSPAAARGASCLWSQICAYEETP